LKKPTEQRNEKEIKDIIMPLLEEL